MIAIINSRYISFCKKTKKNIKKNKQNFFHFVPIIRHIKDAECHFCKLHVSTQKHMWAEHCISSPSSPWWSWWPNIFHPREAIQWKSVLRLDLSRSLYLLLSKVSVLARWSASFSCLPDYCGLAGERMLQKESAKVFFENPLLRHTSILLPCGISFTYIYVLISFFNEEYRRQQWFLFWIFETFCLYCWVMLMLMLAREKYFGNQVSHLPASCRPRWLIVHPREFSTKVFVSSAPFGTLLLITKNFRQL